MNIMFASVFRVNVDTLNFVLIELHEPMLTFRIVDCISGFKMYSKGAVKHNNLKFGLPCVFRICGIYVAVPFH